MLEENNLAYIQLLNFGQNTGDELRGILEELLAQNPDGLILDLRNNGGGYLIRPGQLTSPRIYSRRCRNVRSLWGRRTRHLKIPPAMALPRTFRWWF